MSDIRTVFGQKCVVYDAQNHKILMLQRSDYKKTGIAQDHNDHHTRDMIGGRVDIGEEAKDAIRREGEEEAGIVLNNLRPIDIHSRMVPSGAFFIFTLRWCDDYSFIHGDVELSDEHTGWEWMGVDRVQTVELRETVKYVLPLIVEEMKI